MNEEFDPNNLEKKLLEAKNATDKQHFSKGEDYIVNIRKDESIGPAKFLPDPFIPGGYKANSLTIKALRKEIFAAGSELFEDLEKIENCHGCNHNYDLQFWKMCPYCGQAPSKS